MENRHPPVDAPDSATPDSPQWKSVGGRFLRFRPWAVGPGGALSWCVMAWGGAPSRQLVAVGVGFSLVWLAFVWEARRTRTVQPGAESLWWSMVLTTGALTLMSGATGGLQSPFLPIFFAPVVTSFAAFGAGRRALASLGVFVAALVVLACLPEGWPFPVLGLRTRNLIQPVAMMVAMALLYASVTGLTQVHGEVGRALARARRRSLEEASARLRQIETLSARVAHEMKNPLAAIKGLLQLHRRSLPEGGKPAERIGVAMQEIERMEEILGGYLSFAKPVEGLTLQRVDLAVVLQDLGTLVSGQAAQKGVSWHCDPVAVSLQADPARLQEALLNLALNALAATPEGGQVSVEASLVGDEVVFVVKDTGCGMPQEVLSRATEAFFTTKPEGTGLGLVVARSVALQHGGALVLRSQPDVGTCVTLTLPQGGL